MKRNLSVVQYRGCLQHMIEPFLFSAFLGRVAQRPGHDENKDARREKNPGERFICRRPLRPEEARCHQPAPQRKQVEPPQEFYHKRQRDQRPGHDQKLLYHAHIRKLLSKHFSTNIIPHLQIPVKFSHELEVKAIKEVKIPKEIRQYKESIFFGLSARQFFCAIFAVGIAAGAYLLLGDVIGKETASWLCIVLAAPAAMAGFFNYNGMTFEQFLWAVIKTEFLFAGDRKYIGENLCYNSFNRKGRGDFD